MMTFRSRYGDVTVHYDPGSGDATGIEIMKYKGKTTQDAAAFYAPYVPLQMVAAFSLPAIVATGPLWVKVDRAAIAGQAINWCKEVGIQIIFELESNIFRFKSEADQTAFILRWQGE